MYCEIEVLVELYTEGFGCIGWFEYCWYRICRYRNWHTVMARSVIWHFLDIYLVVSRSYGDLIRSYHDLTRSCRGLVRSYCGFRDFRVGKVNQFELVGCELDGMFLRLSTRSL